MKNDKSWIVYIGLLLLAVSMLLFFLGWVKDVAEGINEKATVSINEIIDDAFTTP